MRIRIRSFVAAGKICKVLLLGVVTMAMAIPGRDVALGQTATGSSPYTFTAIDAPGASLTYPDGINDAGQIVGTFVSTADGRLHGFSRTAGGTFTTIDVPNSTGTSAIGINGAGQIVGGFRDSGGVFHGFLRDAGGAFTTIDPPGATTTSASGINDTGQIVGFFVDAGGAPHSFVRDAGGTFTTIDDVPGAIPGSTHASGINNAGEIVGSFFIVGVQGYHGFLRDAAGTFTTFDAPGALYDTKPSGINDAGQIMGTFNIGNASHGFVRDAGGTFTTIDDPDTIASGPPNGTGTMADGINDAGQIVGFWDSGGAEHGYLAVPNPIAPFAAFSAKVEIIAAAGAFGVLSRFTPGSGGSIDPLTQDVTFQLGDYSVTIPAGSFHLHAGDGAKGDFVFEGAITGVPLGARIRLLRGGGYLFMIGAAGAPNLPTTNPVMLELIIGNSSGSIRVNAGFGGD